jgi:hypothetical protein
MAGASATLLRIRIASHHRQAGSPNAIRGVPLSPASLNSRPLKLSIFRQLWILFVSHANQRKRLSHG